MEALAHMQDWEQILTFIGVVFATLTAAYYFYKRILKRSVCNFCESVRRFFKVGDFLEDLIPKVEFVYNELKPNSGTSVKDSIKRIEDNIIVLMNKHRIILDDYQTGIIETNEKGEITWANSTYLEFTNRDLREVIGNGWVNAIHPEDREKVYAEWQNALEQARNFEAAFRVVKQDGSIVHVQGHAFPIKGRERIQGYIGKIKIVMENKQHA
jgi:PAS domain S-box-containing protein